MIKFQILLYICAIPVKYKVDFHGGNSSALMGSLETVDEILQVLKTMTL